MSIKKILRRLKQRIIDIDIGKVEDKIIDVDIGRIKDKIIEINHVFSRIFHKIIIIDHEALVFLTVVCVVTGSLVGFGICTMRRGERQSEPSGDLNAMIKELETELSSVRDMLEVRDTEIEALNSALAYAKGDTEAIIISVEWNIANDNLRLLAKFYTTGMRLQTIGVKRVEPESDWYSVQNPIEDPEYPPSLIFGYYWNEEDAGAPEGFLTPNTQYRVAMTYLGGYDEVTVNSSGEY